MASWLSRLASPLATAFRETVSGSKDGLPEWAKQMAEGDDEGLFGPDSAVWEVHGALSTLVGGVRALLLQAVRLNRRLAYVAAQPGTLRTLHL